MFTIGTKSEQQFQLINSAGNHTIFTFPSTGIPSPNLVVKQKIKYKELKSYVLNITKNLFTVNSLSNYFVGIPRVELGFSASNYDYNVSKTCSARCPYGGRLEIRTLKPLLWPLVFKTSSRTDGVRPSIQYFKKQSIPKTFRQLPI